MPISNWWVTTLECLSELPPVPLKWSSPGQLTFIFLTSGCSIRVMERGFLPEGIKIVDPKDLAVRALHAIHEVIRMPHQFASHGQHPAHEVEDSLASPIEPVEPWGPEFNDAA